MSELLRSIGPLALGYEDLNHHDRLRLDPLQALMAGKADVLGEDRLCQEDRGKALAAHSTLTVRAEFDPGRLSTLTAGVWTAEPLASEPLAR